MCVSVHFCCITLAPAPGALAHKQGRHCIWWLNPMFPLCDNFQNMYTDHLNASKQLWGCFPMILSVFSDPVGSSHLLAGCSLSPEPFWMVQPTQCFWAQFPGCLFIYVCLLLCVCAEVFSCLGSASLLSYWLFQFSKARKMSSLSPSVSTLFSYLPNFPFLLVFPPLSQSCRFRSTDSHYVSQNSVTENGIHSSWFKQ